METERPCPACQLPFTPKTVRRLFCSDVCKTRHYRNRTVTEPVVPEHRTEQAPSVPEPVVPEQRNEAPNVPEQKEPMAVPELISPRPRSVTPRPVPEQIPATKPSRRRPSLERLIGQLFPQLSQKAKTRLVVRCRDDRRTMFPWDEQEQCHQILETDPNLVSARLLALAKELPPEPEVMEAGIPPPAPGELLFDTIRRLLPDADFSLRQELESFLVKTRPELFTDPNHNKDFEIHPEVRAEVTATLTAIAWTIRAPKLVLP